MLRFLYGLECVNKSYTAPSINHTLLNFFHIAKFKVSESDLSDDIDVENNLDS